MTELVVTRTIDILASKEKVWQALTDPALVAQWFGQQAEIDLRVGGAAAFTWDEFGRVLAVVEEVDPHNTIAYRWAQGPGIAAEPGTSTVARFTLEDMAGGTRLTVTETGWESLEKTEDDIRSAMEGNHRGWLSELTELKDLLEKQDSV